MQITITKEQFCAIGKEYQALYDKSEAYCKQVESISLGDFIVEINAPYLEFLDHTLAALAGESAADWINWFIFETEFGSKESMTDVSENKDGVEKHWNIDSWEALYDFLEENENEKSAQRND